MTHTYYLGSVLDEARRTETIQRLVDYLRARADQFDALAFRGMSGALITPVLAYLLGKKLIMVRKPEDTSHAGCCVEGDDAERIVIVDDFVGAGTTVEKIVKELRNSPIVHQRIVAVFVYNQLSEVTPTVKFAIWDLEGKRSRDEQVEVPEVSALGGGTDGQDLSTVQAPVQSLDYLGGDDYERIPSYYDSVANRTLLDNLSADFNNRLAEVAGAP